MCVNVIQVKLEELFEELLISLMEEYGAQGAGISGHDLKPKLTVLDLWKMWKKRQKRNKPQQQPTGFSIYENYLFLEIEQERLSFNLWKIFPFAKRRREVLLDEYCRRMKQVNHLLLFERKIILKFLKSNLQASKHTQTDTYTYSLHTLNYVQELDEISWNGTPSSNNDVPLGANSPNNVTSSSSITVTNSSSSSDKKRVRVAISENASSSPTVLSSSSSSSYVRRYLPSRRSERRHTTFSNGGSIQSAPNDPRTISPHSAELLGGNTSSRTFHFWM